MKDLHLPLENGLIPLVEIAKILYPDLHEDFDYITNPEFYKDMLLVNVIGDKNGCGITEYLFYEDFQPKIKCYDSYWTGDTSRNYVESVNCNPLLIIKRLLELGVITKDEVIL